MPERKVASTVDRTHNHQVRSPTRSPLNHAGGASIYELTRFTTIDQHNERKTEKLIAVYQKKTFYRDTCILKLLSKRQKQKYYNIKFSFWLNAFLHSRAVMINSNIWCTEYFFFRQICIIFVCLRTEYWQIQHKKVCTTLYGICRKLLKVPIAVNSKGVCL